MWIKKPPADLSKESKFIFDSPNQPIIFLIQCLGWCRWAPACVRHQKKSQQKRLHFWRQEKYKLCRTQTEPWTSEPTWDWLNYSAGFELIIVLVFVYQWMLTTSFGTQLGYTVNVSAFLRDAPWHAGVCDWACNERTRDKDCLTENKYHY